MHPHSELHGNTLDMGEAYLTECALFEEPGRSHSAHGFSTGVYGEAAIPVLWNLSIPRVRYK